MLGSVDKDQLDKLIDVGPGLVEELDVDVVLRRVLEVARELTGARYAALGVLDEAGVGLERFVTVGLTDDERARIGDLPRGRGVLGELIRNPEPLRLPDVGRHPRSYGFPVGHPPMTTFLGVPVRVLDNVYGNLYLTEKEGGREFDADDEDAVVVLARWAGAAIQNARLYRTLDDRHRELERTLHVLETTDEITRAIGAETELDRVLELIVKRARALVEARSVVLELVEGGDLLVANAAGDVDQSLVGRSLPAAGSAGGYVLEKGRAMRLSEVPAALAAEVASVVLPTAGLLVPMTFRGRPIGLIAAFDRMTDGPDFAEDDRRLLSAFAASASIAVATAQRAAEQTVRRSIEASEDERKRWARELHDQTLQDIGAVRVVLSSALQTGDEEQLRHSIGQATDELARASAALRELISDLRPAALDQLGVAPALEALAGRIRENFGLAVDLRVELRTQQGDEQRRLVPELETIIYRIVQEALTNVVKHAGARRAEVSVTEADGMLDVAVSDDGSGFDADGAHPGFGLAGMQERAAQAGGRLSLESNDSGTVLRTRLPVRRLPEPPSIRPKSPPRLRAVENQ